MTTRLMWVAVLALTVVSCGGEGGRFHIPASSTDLPETFSGYHPAHHIAEALVLAPVSDVRRAHVGERVGGTSWRTRMTDTFGERGGQVLEDRLAAALTHASLFAKIVRGEPPAPDALVLHTDVRGFCAQASGVFFVRVGGMAALDVSLTRGDRVLWGARIEHVVTDADTDPEYTGARGSSVEQRMRRTMADSLRLTTGDLLRALDRLAGEGKRALD